MSFLDEIKRSYQNILPSGYQIKKILINFGIRILFLVVAFFVYFALIHYIPDNIHSYLEIVMVFTLTISILIFLPFFEKISHIIKGKYLFEYVTEDASVSRLAYKRFDINSLIKSVFPDMVKISGSDSGRLGILKEDGTFDIYNYNRGRQKKIHTRNENTTMNQLIQFLVKYKDGVSISDTVNFPEINDDFVALRADFIIPFMLREDIFGFLAVSSIPDKEGLQQLNVLSRQCALIIHNQNLSAHIVENIKYRQEEESAKRIQNQLQKGNTPKIAGIDITFSSTDPATLVEFYQTQDGLWNFLLLTAGGPPRSAGLVNSYILGLLFSRIKRNQANNFIEVKNLINHTFQKAEWKEKYGYLVGKFLNNHELEILHEGSLLRVYDEKFSERPLTSIGWKNIITADSYPIIVELRGREFMRIEKS
jgi:hypothetical protein